MDAHDASNANEPTIGVENLDHARFDPERRARESIEADAELRNVIEWARKSHGVHTMRQRLLSNAVRVNERTLPNVAQSFEHIARRAGVEKPLEPFVYSSPELNAAVIPGREHMIVILSSSAVERLEPNELDFVIGHELGHASFGHLDLPATALVMGGENLPPKQAMRLMSWQRMAEISADRAGLVCCGSLDTAATAMFKTISGLTLEHLVVDPSEFANQWDELASELTREARMDQWMSTHPFPPLRMQAMLSFYDTEHASEHMPEADGTRSLAEVDREIQRMLAMIDPLAPGSDDETHTDPLLHEFLLWGGMYVAAADGHVDDTELENLTSLVGKRAIDACRTEGFQPPDAYRERFIAAKENRRKPLCALELQRIFSALALVAKADGHVADEEVTAMKSLAQSVGVADGFVLTLL